MKGIWLHAYEPSLEITVFHGDVPSAELRWVAKDLMDFRRKVEKGEQLVEALKAMEE